jgi:hypothetical protein
MKSLCAAAPNAFIASWIGGKSFRSRQSALIYFDSVGSALTHLTTCPFSQLVTHSPTHLVIASSPVRSRQNGLIHFDSLGSASRSEAPNRATNSGNAYPANRDILALSVPYNDEEHNSARHRHLSFWPENSGCGDRLGHRVTDGLGIVLVRRARARPRSEAISESLLRSNWISSTSTSTRDEDDGTTIATAQFSSESDDPPRNSAFVIRHSDFVIPP